LASNKLLSNKNGPFEQSAAASEELVAQVEVLMGMVPKFKLKDRARHLGVAGDVNEYMYS
jgi:hypothetical protein